MTPQEIFTTVRNHLLTQMRRAVAFTEDGERCLYRDKYGNKCAVGCLIPDELYDPAMENTDIHKLFHHFPKLQEQLGIDNVDGLELLATLQSTHDHFEPDQWEHHLQITASRYNLNWEPRS